jgi:hypothetical protein
MYRCLILPQPHPQFRRSVPRFSVFRLPVLRFPVIRLPVFRFPVFRCSAVPSAQFIVDNVGHGLFEPPFALEAMQPQLQCTPLGQLVGCDVEADGVHPP